MPDGIPYRIDANRSARDAALVRRIANGDTDAMRSLYVLHSVRVFRFLLRLAHDRTLAEDLTSDVFLEVWRRACQFEGRSTVSTWVLAIARYKVIAEFRRRKMEYVDEAAIEMIDHPANPRELEKKHLRIANVRRCIVNLPAKYREIIDLFYFQEKTVEEIAALLSIPAGTVKSRMFYARKWLTDLVTKSPLEIV
jgi:RNA polymerase sigma-70 factor, ECF subfamily